MVEYPIPGLRRLIRIAGERGPSGPFGLKHEHLRRLYLGSGVAQTDCDAEVGDSWSSRHHTPKIPDSPGAMNMGAGTRCVLGAMDMCASTQDVLGAGQTQDATRKDTQDEELAGLPRVASTTWQAQHSGTVSKSPRLRTVSTLGTSPDLAIKTDISKCSDDAGRSATSDYPGK